MVGVIEKYCPRLDSLQTRKRAKVLHCTVLSALWSDLVRQPPPVEDAQDGAERAAGVQQGRGAAARNSAAAAGAHAAAAAAAARQGGGPHARSAAADEVV